MWLKYWGKIVNQKPVSIVKRYYWWKMVDDYSAMRWPCPEWFHVPSKNEWAAITTVWIYLWGGNNDWTNFGVAFKLPFAGTRIYSSAEVSDQGTKAFYWSYTKYSTNSAYYFRANSTSFGTNYAYYRAHGLSLRPFKDSPIIPTSSWTKLYWTSIEAWGIFWDSTSWLISVSANWQTWITIADKNLWATTVWNAGDTLTEANCGWYFQWWNNYMFPFTWTVTTSSTQVDASNYWPWNYYNSSTFIIWSGDWSSVQNDNLRWGDTWVQQRPAEVIKVYKWNIQIRPNMPAEFTDWDSWVVSAVSAELQWNIDDTILNLFWETFYIALDDDIGNGDSLEDLWWVYDTITSGNDEWNWLQISDWGDMTDMNHIIPYNDSATDAVCIVRDNDDRTDVEYLVWTSSGHGSFAFQLSSLATHFSGKDTVCMFIFLT